MKNPADDNSIFSIDVIEPLVQETFELNHEDPLISALNNSLGASKEHAFSLSTQVHEVLAQLDALGVLAAGGPSLLIFESEKPLPSIVHAPTVELQEFPKAFEVCFSRKR